MTTQHKNHGSANRTTKSLTSEARALLEATSEIADEKVVAARKSFSEALDHGKEAYAVLESKVIENAKVADRAVRENPYKAMTVAFGVGAFLGLLLVRRPKTVEE